MANATLNAFDRYAFVGKTGSGKTRTAIVLAATIAISHPEPWEVWWIDTKDVKEDIIQLRLWGFRNVASKKDRTQTGGLPNAIYYLVREETKDGKPVEDSVVNQCQQIFAAAYKRGHVLVVIDEYTQVVVSKQNPGAALTNIFSRGRGKEVGVMGLTQEPVFVPRMLLSQATHLVLFSLTFTADIDYIRKLYKEYVPPMKLGDRWGFYWGWIDGNGIFTYYPNQAVWYDSLNVAQPTTPVVPAQTG